MCVCVCVFLGLAAWLAGALRRNRRLLGSWWCVALALPEVAKRTTLFGSLRPKRGTRPGEWWASSIQSHPERREIKPWHCVPVYPQFLPVHPISPPTHARAPSSALPSLEFWASASAAQAQVPGSPAPPPRASLFIFVAFRCCELGSPVTVVSVVAVCLLHFTSLQFRSAWMLRAARFKQQARFKLGFWGGRRSGRRGSAYLRRPRQWCLLKCDLFNDFPQPLYKFPISSYIRRCSAFSIISVSLLVFGNGSWKLSALLCKNQSAV